MKPADKDGATRLEVHAKPRAKKSRILGFRDGVLDVALAAPPVDGAANEELVRLMATSLGIRRKDVVLVRGESSRTKLVEIRGVQEDELRATLLELSSPPSAP